MRMRMRMREPSDVIWERKGKGCVGPVEVKVVG